MIYVFGKGGALFARIFCRELCTAWHLEKKIILTIFFTLVITVTAVLMLSGMFLCEMEGFLEQNRSKITYDIVVDGYGDIERLVTMTGIPGFFQIMAQSSANMEEDGYSQLLIEDWIFPEGTTEVTEEDYQTEVLEGRFFSKKELEDGNCSVILSKSAKEKYFPMIKIGQEISYFGYSFRLIGIMASEGKDILLPAYCVKNLTETNLHSFKISKLLVVFKKPLSGTQVKSIESSLKSYQNGTVELKSDFEILLFDYYMRAIKYIFLLGAILLFCLMIIAGLFRYYFGLHIPEYVIYKICGIPNLYFWGLVYGQTILYGTISYLTGLLLYFVFQKSLIRFEISSYLTVAEYLWVYAALIVIQLLTVTPIAVKLQKLLPMNRELWRDAE